MTNYLKTGLVAVAVLLFSFAAMAQSNPLIGSWRLIAADKVLPDGRRLPDYGSAPAGLAVFTSDNHYVVEIFSSERLKFASGNRSAGTPGEYKDAVLSTSCHFGTYAVDVTNGTISFQIERSSFPNYDGTTRTNPFMVRGTP
ncbi:lipocalin-like domain-containing protein [Puia sp. P3]|uniref:lipocalin-like domain-containing protein n=1 Tax=Puia sp. P3 TaxID=3423952 RepID=UPI003D671F3B